MCAWLLGRAGRSSMGWEVLGVLHWCCLDGMVGAEVGGGWWALGYTSQGCLNRMCGAGASERGHPGRLARSVVGWRDLRGTLHQDCHGRVARACGDMSQSVLGNINVGLS